MLNREEFLSALFKNILSKLLAFAVVLFFAFTGDFELNFFRSLVFFVVFPITILFGDVISAVVKKRK